MKKFIKERQKLAVRSLGFWVLWVFWVCFLFWGVGEVEHEQKEPILNIRLLTHPTSCMKVYFAHPTGFE